MEPRRARRGARALALEGVFESLARGLGESYLAAFALFLNAGGMALALVASLHTAAAAIAQVFAHGLPVRPGSIRRFLSWIWSAQSLALAPLGLCAFLSWPWSVAALVLGAFVAWGLSGVAIPAWTSMVAGWVPRQRHGWFFALRGMSQQIGVLSAILGGSLLLSRMTERGQEALGFALLFACAGLIRVAGVFFLAAVPQPAAAGPGLERPRLKDMRISGRARRLAFYLWGLHFGTNVATPFFVPYMLSDLRFSYARVGLLLAVPALVKVLSARWWGLVADRYGPGPLLRFSGWQVAVIPILWLLSASPWWILACQIVSGLAWGAFELARASSLLRVTDGRQQEVALFNTVDGGMIIGGALLGGAAVDLFGGLGWSGYGAAMVVSTVLRLLPAIILLWRVRGIGRPSWSHRRMPVRAFTVRPTRGLSYRPLEDLPSAATETEDEQDGSE